jgi:hypothetical protein
MGISRNILKAAAGYQRTLWCRTMVSVAKGQRALNMLSDHVPPQKINLWPALLWPVWAWKASYRFRKAQVEENEKIYEREQTVHAAAFRARRDQRM